MNACSLRLVQLIPCATVLFDAGLDLYDKFRTYVAGAPNSFPIPVVEQLYLMLCLCTMYLRHSFRVASPLRQHLARGDTVLEPPQKRLRNGLAAYTLHHARRRLCMSPNQTYPMQTAGWAKTSRV